MNYKREIEKKYVLTHPRYGMQELYEVARFQLRGFFPDAEILEGRSTDTFWTQKGTDFIRLRRNTSELSVKITDKATIEDRVEENVVVEDYDTAWRFSTAVFGQPVGTLEKNYYVLTMPDVIVCLYTVTGDDRVFLEVESESITKVTEVSHELMEYFDMRQEMRSLFQIVFGDL